MEKTPLYMLFCVTALLVQLTSTEWFTSILRAERMLSEEGDLLQEIDHFIDSQFDRLKKINKLISERSVDVSSRVTLGKDLSHPNAAFHVVKDFATSYTDALGDNLGVLSRYKRDLLLTDESDYKGAMESLVRIKNVYHLNITDMIKGDYLGFQGPQLSALDVFQIGNNTILEEAFDESIEWLNTSLHMNSSVDLTEMDESNDHPSSAIIKAHIGFIYLIKGNVSVAKELYTEAHATDPTEEVVNELAEMIENFNESMMEPDIESDYGVYGQLCRHELIPNKNFINTPQIVCRYREALLPYYRFKEELLSIEPFVSVIYDFISDRESQHVIDLSRTPNRLHRGRVSSQKDKKFIVSRSRTGQIGWLMDYESAVVKDLSLRIQHLTGLNTTDIEDYAGQIAGENLQVVNYGIGGHYDIHFDSTDIDEGLFMDRVATFLIYLNDVDKGGSTVFTDVNLSVAPKKNMALFWYNYNVTCHLDLYTRHAGCPVVHGQKWIANKWIRVRGSTFRRRCGLRPNVTQLDIEEDMRRGYK